MSMRVMILCQGCSKQGLSAFGSSAQPRWCSCVSASGERAKAALKRGGLLPGGPYVMAPGHVVAVVFQTTTEHEFAERCRLAGNAERTARDELSARFVRSGRGWRELPRSHPKRAALEGRYATALRALRKLQKECQHPRRSMFNGDACGVCYKAIATVAA